MSSTDRRYIPSRKGCLMDAKEARESLGFNEQDIFYAAKRLGMVWTPWMGDWFTSYSPRNDNSNAEGTWEHWVTLAQAILNHPFTELVRPEVFAAVPEPPERYSETERYLTDEEMMAALRPDVYPKANATTDPVD